MITAAQQLLGRPAAFSKVKIQKLLNMSGLLASHLSLKLLTNYIRSSVHVMTVEVVKHCTTAKALVQYIMCCSVSPHAQLLILQVEVNKVHTIKQEYLTAKSCHF
jgi:hypothetical protein